MIVVDELKSFKSFYWTGRKYELEQQLKNSLDDTEMYQVARELKKVLKELDKVKDE